MFSKILTKLIDQAIVPAVIILATRIISIVFICQYLGIAFTLDASGFSFVNPKDYILVNSYTIFTTVIILTIGLLYVLLKSRIFHEDTISPVVTARLFSLRVPSLIQTSFDIYSQGAIWSSYMYLLTLITAYMSFSKLIYSWVFYIALFFTILTTVLLVFDIEQKVKVVKKKGIYLDEDDTYLERKDK